MTQRHDASTRKSGPLGRDNLDLVLDLELPLSVDLGTTSLSLAEALELESGSVVELDGEPESPVELSVNGRVVASGELVVIDGTFAVRVLAVKSPAERLLSCDPVGAAV